jgi:hypothetical protein
MPAPAPVQEFLVHAGTDPFDRDDLAADISMVLKRHGEHFKQRRGVAALACRGRDLLHG